MWAETVQQVGFQRGLCQVHIYIDTHVEKEIEKPIEGETEKREGVNQDRKTEGDRNGELIPVPPES